MTEEFYIETIDRVFHKAELAKGELVDPSAITCTARAPDGRGRTRRYLRAWPDVCGPRAVQLAPPPPEAPPPAGQCGPLRRLQRQALGARDLPGRPEHDPVDGVIHSARRERVPSPMGRGYERATQLPFRPYVLPTPPSSPGAVRVIQRERHALRQRLNYPDKAGHNDSSRGRRRGDGTSPFSRNISCLLGRFIFPEATTAGSANPNMSQHRHRSLRNGLPVVPSSTLVRSSRSGSDSNRIPTP